MKEKKMKICFAIPFPPPYGGISNWSVLLKNYIDSKQIIDYEVLDISPQKKSMNNINIFSRVFENGINLVKLKARLKNLLDKNRFDVFHITTSGGLSIIRDIKLLKIAHKKGVDCVYHIRFGRIPEIIQKNTTEWKLVKKALKYADKIIAIDRKTFISLKKNGFENTYLVPNPFDDSKILNIINAPYNLENTIVYAGWVIKEKGIEELLKAWEVIYDLHKDYSLKICGPYKNDYMNYLRSKYKFEGVLFLGELKNEELLKEVMISKIFVFPSHTEGFPNAVVEAMALTKPVIATKVGAIPEMLENDCGILIEKENIDDIVFSVNKLIDEDEYREKLAKNARKKVEDEYLISHVFEKYYKIWGGNS